MKPLHQIVSLFLLMFLTSLLTTAVAQVSQYVVEVKIPSAIEKTPLSISVDLAQNTQVRRVVLNYRQFGESEYKELEMLLSGRTAVAAIPGNSVVPPFVEYFIKIQLANGSEAFFPSESPEANPLKISVKGVDPKDAEVRFLSPEPGETLAAEDLAVAISLMYTSDAVDKQRTRLFLDGADVTKEALLSDDVLLYSPKNFDKPLNLGAHSIRIELHDTLGRLYYSKQTNFNLSTASAIEEEKTSLQYMGNAQVELRNEKIGGINTNYTRGDLHLGGAYKFLAFGYDMHLTNEDKPDRQPQNRFLGTLQADEYLKLQVGDAYPMFPSLFISGKRVRGITGSVTTGYVNVDVSYGKTMRAVEGIEKGIVTYANSSLVNADNIDKKLVRDSLTYMRFERGTFGQNFLAVRPSFGSGENFQLGFTYIKAQDDTNSIRYGRYPTENFVAGTDLLLAFDNQRVKWTTQVAFSLLNTNIEGGNYSDADFDQYKLASATTHEDSVKALKESQDLKDLAKLGRKFITVNPNMSPIDPTSGFPSLSFETELTLNYFNNFIRALVFRRGKDYTSYGNEYLQKDIAGINISDRIRFLDNRLLTSVSYETKWNNLQNDPGQAVTTFNMFNGSVTVYPGAKLPTITIGYGYYTRKNPIDLSNYITANKPIVLDVDTVSIVGWSAIKNNYSVIPSSDGRSIANEVTNRFFLAANHDFYLGGRQSANASFSIANKTDNTFYLRDQDNLNFATALTTYYKIPLQTTVSVVLSHNVSYNANRIDSTRAYLSTKEKTEFNYQTISLNARYRMLNDKLNLLASIAPSFGDFKRTLVQAGADYQVLENHFLVGQIDLIQNPGKSSDVIFSVLYRFSF